MSPYLAPAIADYVLASGQPKRDPAAGLATAIYLRLMVPLGSWWADVALGSRLHELAREKDLPRVAKLARQYAESALAPILEDGRAREIDITTEQPRIGRLHLRVEVLAAGGERLTFTHPVQVL